MWKPCFTRKFNSTMAGLPRNIGVMPAGAISTDGPPLCATAAPGISAANDIAVIRFFTESPSAISFQQTLCEGRLKADGDSLPQSRYWALLLRHAAAAAERLLDPVLDVAAAAQPEHPRYYLAVAANVETGRQVLQPAVLVAHRLLAQQHRVIHAHFLGELRDLIFAGIIHRDAEDLQALRPVLLLQFHEPRHLQPAWCTPGGPEIQQHRLAPKVGQMHGLAVQRLQGKIGRRRARLGTSGRSPARALALVHQVLPADQHDRNCYNHHDNDRGISPRVWAVGFRRRFCLLCPVWSGCGTLRFRLFDFFVHGVRHGHYFLALTLWFTFYNENRFRNDR